MNKLDEKKEIYIQMRELKIIGTNYFFEWLKDFSGRYPNFKDDSTNKEDLNDLDKFNIFNIYVLYKIISDFAGDNKKTYYFTALDTYYEIGYNENEGQIYFERIKQEQNKKIISLIDIRREYYKNIKNLDKLSELIKLKSQIHCLLYDNYLEEEIMEVIDEELDCHKVKEKIRYEKIRGNRF